MIMRKDVPEELTWDLSSIYADEEEMYRDAEKMEQLAKEMAKRYKGRLTDAETINACLDDFREVELLATLTGTYADLAVSVDYYDSHNQERNENISRRITEVYSKLSFVRSEIIEQSEEVLASAIELADANKLYLKDVLRDKQDQLSPETEQVLAALSKSFDAPYDVYNMAKLADMKFPPFEADGKEYPLGYALFEDNYSYEADAAIRRNAFQAFSAKLREYGTSNFNAGSRARRT